MINPLPLSHGFVDGVHRLFGFAFTKAMAFTFNSPIGFSMVSPALGSAEGPVMYDTDWQNPSNSLLYRFATIKSSMFKTSADKAFVLTNSTSES